MLVSGWGRYPKINANVFNPSSVEECKELISKYKIIPRGMGRSYGDSANYKNIIQTTYFDHYIDFDFVNGYLTCEAGTKIIDILDIIVKKGWFLPVTPGSSQITIGGAIASDVHGKNHHLSGTFSKYVKEISLLTGLGDILEISENKNKLIFHATCGGMGLTGLILKAKIKLLKIKSNYIIQKTIKTTCLEEVCEKFEEYSNHEYSVAWLDCLSKGKFLGKSVLMLGKHADDQFNEKSKKISLNIPVNAPSQILNKFTIKSFNKIYYAMAKHNEIKHVDLQSYFYPLDSIQNWNRLYGQNGFVQYQFVIPKSNGIKNLKKILLDISENTNGSFLAVLKKFGNINRNLLTFPTLGYTLSLDFKISKNIFIFLKNLDENIADYGGRIYLSKDALMNEDIFKKTYPRWIEFEELRHKIGASGKFSSTQSERLGLS